MRGMQAETDTVVQKGDERQREWNVLAAQLTRMLAGHLQPIALVVFTSGGANRHLIVERPAIKISRCQTGGFQKLNSIIGIHFCNLNLVVVARLVGGQRRRGEERRDKERR